MRNNLRSAVTMTGRRMAGARSLWRANGMKDEQFGMPVIGIVNSFTQFVPGHTHLHEIGQYVKTLIEERGCFAAEFNTIAIDDGIAMATTGCYTRFLRGKSSPTVWNTWPTPIR